MPLKLASDLLPAASDALPNSAKIIRLPRPAQARQTPTRITKATVGRLVCPAGQKEAFYWDSEIAGFGLRVYPSGRKTWVLQYRDAGGRTRRHPIGQASAIDAAAARKLAGDLLTRVAGGANPSVERRQARKAATVGDIFETYLIHAEAEQRPSSFDQTRRNLRKYAARLHREAITEIDRAAVSRLTSFLEPKSGAFRRTGCWPHFRRHGFGRSALALLLVTIPPRMCPSLTRSRARGFLHRMNCG